MSTTTTNDTVHSLLKDRRLDEIVNLSQDRSVSYQSASDESWPTFFTKPLGAYVQYLLSTWYGLILLIWSNELPLKDLATSIVFANLTSLVLLFALFWCQLAHSPTLYKIYFFFSGKYANGLGLVNAANPQFFNALTQAQIQAAKTALITPPELLLPSKPTEKRVFDLDIAKLLLQLASVVYERQNHATFSTIDLLKSQLPDAQKQGSKAVDGLKAKAQAKLEGEEKTNGEDAIASFCERFGLEYEPISELNGTNSATCTLFWARTPKPFIIVVFKGTGIASYADWITDLTTTLVAPASTALPLFSAAKGRVIKGFHDRLFGSPPAANMGGRGEGGQGRSPWETIVADLCTVGNYLAQHSANPDEKINVWFTGHSLGCALASLAYTRAASTNDLSPCPSLLLRDAYLFAAPVCTDRTSARAFDAMMSSLCRSSSQIRNVWRITNATDAVATLLPQLGDRDDLQLSETNPAAFAHLGAEIKMKDAPEVCDVTYPSGSAPITLHPASSPSPATTPSAIGGDSDSFFPRTLVVEIRSAFSRDQILALRNAPTSTDSVKAKLAAMKDAERVKLGKLAEKIPLIGRFIAHDTVLYWDQLERIALGECKWLKA